MHEQVEERLKFYESGEAPRKNVDVMKEAISEVSASQGVTSEKKKKKKRKKEKNGLNETVEEQKSETPAEEMPAEEMPAEETPSASGKKKKKNKKQSESFEDLSETKGNEYEFGLVEISTPVFHNYVICHLRM
jgi:cobalamin biosynthesis Mg chelatase CobN